MLHAIRHGSRHLRRRHNRNQIQARIDRAATATRGDDSQATQAHSSAASVGLEARIRFAPGIGALAGERGAAVGVGFAADVGILVLVAQVEAQVIDDVALLHDVGLLGEVAGGDGGDEVLELHDEVWVGGGAESREDAELGEEEGAGADGEHGAFFVRVF